MTFDELEEIEVMTNGTPEEALFQGDCSGGEDWEKNHSRLIDYALYAREKVPKLTFEVRRLRARIEPVELSGGQLKTLRTTYETLKSMASRDSCFWPYIESFGPLLDVFDRLLAENAELKKRISALSDSSDCPSQLHSRFIGKYSSATDFEQEKA